MADETVKSGAPAEADEPENAAETPAAPEPEDHTDPGAGEGLSAEQVELLRAEVQSVGEERDRYRDALVHERADFENYRKRNAALERTAFERGSEDAVMRILPVVDNFERALQAGAEGEKFAEGMSMIMRQLQDVLTALGVSEIDTQGEFDPAVHHAVMQAEDEDVPSNQIVETLQKGYRMGDRVIRAAMVKVNK
ncbi:MAG: nucleotide exchange factor GrpE [Clostridia bacterium]|nr:nucleotide exchange factor GrpE [Clostridia bacterium]